MSVPVLCADADDAHGSVELRIQLLALVGRAVVRDLDDVDGTDRRGREQAALRLLAEVAEEYAAVVGRLDVDHDARVVSRRRTGLRARAPATVRRPGTPDLRRSTSTTCGSPGDERVACPARPLAVERPMDDRVDPSDDGGCPAGVIGVPVGEHEQVDAVDRQEVEAPAQRRRIGPGVDERRRAARAQQHRVALADVACRERPRPGAKRPAERRGAHADADRNGDGDQQHRDRSGTKPWPRRAIEHEPERERGAHDEQHRARGIRNPGQSRRTGGRPRHARRARSSSPAPTRPGGTRTRPTAASAAGGSRSGRRSCRPARREPRAGSRARRRARGRGRAG